MDDQDYPPPLSPEVERLVMKDDGDIDFDKFEAIINGRMDQKWAAAAEIAGILGPFAFFSLSKLVRAGTKGDLDGMKAFFNGEQVIDGLRVVEGNEDELSDSQCLPRLMCMLMEIAMGEAALRYTSGLYGTKKEE